MNPACVYAASALCGHDFRHPVVDYLDQELITRV